MTDGDVAREGPMTVRARRVGVRSIFLLFLLVYGFVGLLTGAGLAALSTLEVGPEAARTFLDELGWWAAAIGFVAYGLLGGITAAVAAIVYNVASAVTGGVKLDLTVAHQVEVVPHHRRERVEATPGEPEDGGDEGGPGARDEEGEGDAA